MRDFLVVIDSFLYLLAFAFLLFAEHGKTIVPIFKAMIVSMQTLNEIGRYLSDSFSQLKLYHQNSMI